MVFDAILWGLLTGILLALIALGPSFFTLIKVGIHHSFSKGALFASGIVLSDMLILLFAYLGFRHLLETLFFEQAFSLLGGVLVLVFGINALRHHNNPKSYRFAKNIPDYQYILEGFGLNILNPFTFILWFMVIASVDIQKQYTSYEAFLFYAIVLITIFSTDCLKAYIANQTGKTMSNQLLNKINHVIGFLLILFSFRLFYHFILITQAG